MGVSRKGVQRQPKKPRGKRKYDSPCRMAVLQRAGTPWSLTEGKALRFGGWKFCAVL